MGQFEQSAPLAKKALKPAKRRALVGWIKERFKASTNKACHSPQFFRTNYYGKSQAKDQSARRRRIREIAYARRRFGYQRIHVMLRREGWPVNKNRVRRQYRLEGLQLRMRIRRRKHMWLRRGPVPQPTAPGERSSMDFVHHQLLNGRPFRMLTVVVQLSRESPLIQVDFSMSGHKVAAALNRRLADGPVPISQARLHAARKTDG